MRIFKRITALALAAVIAGAMGLGAAAEIAENEAEPTEIEVYCPVNEDPEFPFNIELDFVQSSIRYVDYDEPVYGFESILDGEALDFSMNVSLKDEFKDLGSYSFELFSSDYSDKLFSGSAESEEVLSIPDMSIAKGYKLSAELYSDSLSAYYGGQFTIQVELDSTVVVDLFYQLSHMDGEASEYTTYIFEKEPSNNSITACDWLWDYKEMVATIDNDDTDHFQFGSGNKVSDDDMDVEDRTGVANLTFSITSLSNVKFRLEFFDMNNRSIGVFQSKSATRVMFCRLNNVEISTDYKIKITGECESDKPVYYYIEPRYEFTLAWYGQYVSKDVDGTYWNSAPVEDLEIKYGSATKPLFKENSSLTGDEAWMTQSCGIVGAAMILRNIYAKANIYDFRTGKSTNILADPYTATLANCQYSISSNTTVYTVTNDKNPRVLNESNLSSAFGVKYVRRNGSINETALKQMIKDYGYVLVYFNDAHFMVVTEIKSGTEKFAKRAVVYDPAASTYSTGANILLSDTKTGYKDMVVGNITRVYAFYY